MVTELKFEYRRTEERRNLLEGDEDLFQFQLWITGLANEKYVNNENGPAPFESAHYSTPQLALLIG